MNAIFARYWRLAATLSDRRLFNREVLFLSFLWVPVRKKLFGRRTMNLRLVFNGINFSFSIRDAADIAVLEEVFVGCEYALALPREPRRIIDIGSHIGASVAYFASIYPAAIIVAYEPDPENFALLKKNTAAFVNVTAVHAAIADTAGEAVLYKNVSSISSSLSEREGTIALVRVPSLTLDIVLAKGADLVKFDVEGAEDRIFTHASQLKLSPVYLGEIHYDLISSSRKEFLSVFTDFSLNERPLKPSRSILVAVADSVSEMPTFT